MADIDRAAFAAAFQTSLVLNGFSQTQAARAWPATNAAMISRAVNGKKLDAGNFLLLCGLAELDPFDFLLIVKQPRVTLSGIRKTLEKRAVKAADQRETEKDF